MDLQPFRQEIDFLTQYWLTNASFEFRVLYPSLEPLDYQGLPSRTQDIYHEGISNLHAELTMYLLLNVWIASHFYLVDFAAPKAIIKTILYFLVADAINSEPQVD